MIIERRRTIFNRVQLEFGKMFALPGIIEGSARALGLGEEETTELLIDAHFERAGKAEVIYGDRRAAYKHLQEALSLDAKRNASRSSK